jgi:hypothetical protein
MLELRALGDVAQDEQAAAGLPGTSSQWAGPYLERPGGRSLRRDPHRDLLPRVRDQGTQVLGEHVDGRAAGEPDPGEPEQARRGGIGVRHVPVGVEHQHRVGHSLDEQAAGDGREAQEALLEQAPGEHRPGPGQEDRCEVELPERCGPDVEQHVGRERQERGRDQGRRL